MNDFWDRALPLLFAVGVASVFSAFIATGLAYYFNRELDKTRRKWEEKRHLVRSIEKFCDQLMDNALRYWTDESPSNAIKVRLLEQEISAQMALINRFINENFAKNKVIEISLRNVLNTVTGGEFAVGDRKPDSEQVALSVNAIINLRMTVARTIKTSQK